MANQRRRSIQPSSSGTFAVPQIPKSRSVSVTGSGSGSIAPAYVQVPSLLGRNSVPSLQQAQETQQVQETREVQRASAPPLVSAAGSVRPPTASASTIGRATSLNVTVPTSVNVPIPSPPSMDVDTPVSMDISPALTPVLSEYDASRIGGGSSSGMMIDTPQIDSRVTQGQKKEQDVCPFFIHPSVIR